MKKKENGMVMIRFIKANVGGGTNAIGEEAWMKETDAAVYVNEAKFAEYVTDPETTTAGNIEPEHLKTPVDPEISKQDDIKPEPKIIINTEIPDIITPTPTQSPPVININTRGITKLRYLKPIDTVDKVKGFDPGPYIGVGWQSRAPATDIQPGEPYFVRTGDDNLVIIDFDYRDKEKVLTMLRAHGFATDDDHAYIVETVNGGLHYYCRVKQCGRPTCDYAKSLGLEHYFTNKNRGTIDIRGDSPGFVFFGAFKNGAYKPIIGSEATIPWVDGWRVKWISAELGKVAGISIGEFLAGRVDLKEPGILQKPETAWLVWANTMIELEKWGYTPEECTDAMHGCKGYTDESMKHDISSYWNHPERIRYKAGQDAQAAREANKGNVNLPEMGDGEFVVSIIPYHYCIKKDGVYRCGEMQTHQIARWKTIQPIKTTNDKGSVKHHINIDGKIYIGSIDEIVKDSRVAKGTHEKYGTIMGVLFQEIIDRANLPALKVLPFAGFHKNGIHYPGIGVDAFDFDDLQAEQFGVDMATIAVDKEAAVKAVFDLYTSMSIQYKDIIWAWGTVAPYLNAISSRIPLKPNLALGGPGGTGKTLALMTQTCKKYGYPAVPITGKNIETTSRLDSIFTCSTLATVLDEINNFPMEYIGTLKSMLTTCIKNFKKGKGAGGQGLTASGSLCSALCMSYNDENPLYTDVMFLERTLDLQINTKATREQAEAFLNVYNSIPDGLIGRYEFDMVKDFTLDDIMAIYDQQQDLPTKGVEARMNQMFRILMTGAVLFKKFYGFDLDMTLLASLITKSREHGASLLISVAQEYITEQQNMVDVENYKRPPWIGSTLIRKDTKLYFGGGNLIDINNRIKGKYTLPSLASNLQRAYKECDYKKTRLNGIQGYWVVIDLGKGFKTGSESDDDDTQAPPPSSNETPETPVPESELDAINAKEGTLYYRIADKLRRIPNWKNTPDTILGSRLRDEFLAGSERAQIGNVINGMRSYHNCRG